MVFRYGYESIVSVYGEFSSVNYGRGIDASVFGGDDVEVASAGTEPGMIAAGAMKALQDFHMDTKGLQSKSLDDVNVSEFDYVISLCDRSSNRVPSELRWAEFHCVGFSRPSSKRQPQCV